MNRIKLPWPVALVLVMTGIAMVNTGPEPPPPLSDTELMAPPSDPMMKRALVFATAQKQSVETPSEMGIWKKPEEEDMSGKVVVQDGSLPIALTREQIKDANYFYRKMQYDPNFGRDAIKRREKPRPEGW